MYRCLMQSSSDTISDTDELTYQAGFTKINYPFDGASSDSGSLRQCSEVPKAVFPTTIKEVPKSAQSPPKPIVLDRDTVADRCRIGIGGNGNSVFIQGHGNGSKYKPKWKK